MAREDRARARAHTHTHTHTHTPKETHPPNYRSLVYCPGPTALRTSIGSGRAPSLPSLTSIELYLALLRLSRSAGSLPSFRPGCSSALPCCMPPVRAPNLAPSARTAHALCSTPCTPARTRTNTHPARARSQSMPLSYFTNTMSQRLSSSHKYNRPVLGLSMSLGS